MSASPDVLTLANGWGQRQAEFRFELLTTELEYIGQVDIDLERPPSIDNNTNRTIKRAMDNVFISPDDASGINPLVHRLRPVMTIPGVTQEFPLGVFVFSTFRREGTGRVWRSATLLDQGALFDTDIPKGWGVAPGTNLAYALGLRFKEHRIPDYEIEDTGYVLRGSEWLVWPTGTSGVDIVYDLCDLAGCYSAYFNNSGRGVVRSVPDLQSVEPILDLDKDQIIHQDALDVTNDLLDAPNRYIVKSSSADYPVDGYWDVPASAPHSKENRGRVIARTYDMQGIDTHAQAAAIAKAKGQSDNTTYEWRDMEIVPQPLLDTFDVLSFEGESEHIQSWSLPLVGDVQTLETRHVYKDAVA